MLFCRVDGAANPSLTSRLSLLPAAREVEELSGARTRVPGSPAIAVERRQPARHDLVYFHHAPIAPEFCKIVVNVSASAAVVVVVVVG